MKHIYLMFAAALLFCSPARAENMIMQRIHQNFEETMILVKEKLNDYGYKVAHIQKCDSGLSDFGYKTDFYKSVFFGKFEETRYLTAKYPQIIPYIPLKIAVIQEEDSVIIVALNPDILAGLFPQKELQIQFRRWESDIRAVFDEVAAAQSL
jgi:uncharacterized protein (DUF302 family)